MRPNKAILLFFDHEPLALEMRLVLETRLRVKVRIESDFATAMAYCTAVVETGPRLQLIMVATGNTHAANRLRDLGKGRDVNFMSVLGSESRIDLLDRVRFLLRQKRGPKPASKECAA